MIHIKAVDLDHFEDGKMLGDYGAVHGAHRKSPLQRLRARKGCRVGLKAGNNGRSWFREKTDYEDIRARLKANFLY